MKRLRIAVFIGLAVTGIYMQYLSGVKADIEKSIVRLHVIAASDSDYDQNLKIKVKDAVIGYLEDKLDSAQDAEQTKEIIQKELKGIAAAAKDELRKNGCNLGVTATLGNFAFPTKHYGDARLPAGRYDALRIIIGEGEGQNWWCVLFPQLCFVNASGGTISDEGKQKLKNVLTEEEYSLIASSINGGMPVRIKFRLLELFGKKQ
ncbi:MAG: Stage II sporulation protein R (spore_II_R) [Firmicutes bacterium ADurb.Bin193]|nr:MAG: Stage II sporulation protein R (spore_II_R) [Firmicutes bacterium ADurb.Bin193]